LKKYFPENEESNLDITSFVKQMITFILVIITSFIFVKFAFEYLLNIKTKTKIPDENNKNRKADVVVDHFSNFYNE
jgi:hypothetical protein